MAVSLVSNDYNLCILSWISFYIGALYSAWSIEYIIYPTSSKPVSNSLQKRQTRYHASTCSSGSELIGALDRPVEVRKFLGEVF